MTRVISALSLIVEIRSSCFGMSVDHRASDGITRKATFVGIPGLRMTLYNSKMYAANY